MRSDTVPIFWKSLFLPNVPFIPKSSVSGSRTAIRPVATVKSQNVNKVAATEQPFPETLPGTMLKELQKAV